MIFVYMRVVPFQDSMYTLSILLLFLSMHVLKYDICKLIYIIITLLYFY